MRIVFIGAVEFSKRCLDAVIRNDGEVVGIITIAEEKLSVHSDYADLSGTSSAHGIPLFRVANTKHLENIKLIRGLKPDVIFVFGWSQLIAQEILDIPQLGCIGTHPSLLPARRGRHPVIWALVEGLEESGLTFFYLTETADTGDILWQKSFQISLEDDARSLTNRIAAMAEEAIGEFLPQLINGNGPRVAQDHAQATYRRKRNKKDGEVIWESSTMTIYNLIRALSEPYPGAHTYVSGQAVKLWESRIICEPLPHEAQSLNPGTVFAAADGRLVVRTGDGLISIVEYECQGDVKIEAGARLGELVGIPG